MVEVRPNITAAPKAKESVLNKDHQMNDLPEPANIDQAVENIASLKSDWALTIIVIVFSLT